MDKVEFKLNPIDYREKWEGLPVISTINVHYRSPSLYQDIQFEIKRLTREFAEVYSNGFEVRWNWKESYQGHYVNP